MEAGHRFLNTTISLAKKHPDETILMVSHAGIIRAMIGIVLGIRPEEYGEKLPFPSNASVQILDFDGERLSLVAFSLDKYLSISTSIEE